MDNTKILFFMEFWARNILFLHKLPFSVKLLLVFIPSAFNWWVKEAAIAQFFTLS